MRKRPLGRTGIVLGELGLGTWGLSGDAYGAVKAEDAEKTIARAVELGVELFETADVYGGGAIESALGRLLPKGTGVVCTKLGTDLVSKPPRKRFDIGFIRASFEKSQARLQREVIDVVLLHNPTMVALKSGEGLEYLAELKKTGAIRAYGVSAGDVDTARLAIKRGAEVIELAYNVFLSKDLHELSDDIASTETAVLARSVLAHGLLTGHWSPEREFYPGDHRVHRWTEAELKGRVAQLDALRPMVGMTVKPAAENRKAPEVMTLRSAALRYVLANNLVSVAVLGPKSVAQLEQLVREAGDGPPYLKDTALAELATRLKRVGVIV